MIMIMSPHLGVRRENKEAFPAYASKSLTFLCLPKKLSENWAHGPWTSLFAAGCWRGHLFLSYFPSLVFSEVLLPPLWRSYFLFDMPFINIPQGPSTKIVWYFRQLFPVVIFNLLPCLTWWQSCYFQFIRKAFVFVLFLSLSLFSFFFSSHSRATLQLL